MLMSESVCNIFILMQHSFYFIFYVQTARLCIISVMLILSEITLSHMLLIAVIVKLLVNNRPTNNGVRHELTILIYTLRSGVI